MYESRDPLALRGSLHASGFHLESFHEVLDGLSVPLLDIVDFYGIFDVLLLLHEALPSVPPVLPLGNFLREPLGPLFRHRILPSHPHP
ncbi:hypothetical protein Tco_0698912 [Tanacetum coccineum]